MESVNTTAVFGYVPRYIFIPLFIIFAAACLIIAGCTDEDPVDPANGDGIVPDDPVCPSYSPWVEITEPFTEIGEDYPIRFEFKWKQERDQAITHTRYFVKWLPPGENSTGIMNTLNSAPEELEDLWSDWEQWDPEGGNCVAGEDFPLWQGLNLFAVQAKDSCGNVTEHFELSRNAREFFVRRRPLVLVIWEPMLGTGRFSDSHIWTPSAVQVLSGIEFTFRWNAESAYSWFGPVEYRYGWDIQNLDDDSEWTPWSPEVKQSTPKSFNSGVHVFHAEAIDDAGAVTRARIEIEIIPYTAEHDLLWIDDYALGGFIPSMTDPSEEVHDAFWTGICSMAPGFDPERDIFEADQYNDDGQIPLPVLAGYRNAIWTYNSSWYTTWKESVECIPASAVPFPRPGNFKMFLAAGGNALTCGRADRSGGFGETFPVPPELPASVVDELLPGDYDREIAKHSIAHNDYYITVIDKVSGVFKSGEDMVPGVNRSLERDALRMAVEADNSSGLDLPDTLMLDEIVTCSSCFFYPMTRGFSYVEAYDPEYYMDHIFASSHPCFTPLYRMKSRSSISPLNDAVIALRGTSGSCEQHRQTQYYSYHFGFPLWFMEHEKVEQIMDEIFRSWDIK